MKSVINYLLTGAVLAGQEAASVGAELVELRMDFLTDFDMAQPENVLQQLFTACRDAEVVPIVTIRPKWEG